jgi:glycosyltransferase involved in cell wall biosynthesis
LIKQSLKEIEIIIINDGSTDRSSEIINNYKSKNSDIIKSFDKPNGGIADVRNFGLQHITAPYFTFLDSDDYIENDALELLYLEAIRSNADVVMSDFWWTYPNNEKISTDGPYKSNKDLLINMFATLWNKLYRTEFIRSINVSFPTGYRYEDASFLYKIVPYINKWSYINKPFVHYVQRDGSITHNHNEKVKDMIYVFNDILAFYQERGIYSDFKKELEYLFIRFFLGNSFLRSTQIRDHLDRKNTLKLSYDILKNTFPDWKKNEYLNQSGLKNKYYKTVNNLTFKIYSIVFYLYFRYIKKDRVS